MATYPSYAGTGTAPTRLPSVYYGALTRATNDAGADGSFATTPGTEVPYNASLPRFFVAARETLGAATLNADTLGPLALMAGSGEFEGFVELSQSGEGDGHFVEVFSQRNDPAVASGPVAGLSAADGIKLAMGEDDLRCAVQGSIEGGGDSSGRCSLAGLVGFSDLALSFSTYTSLASASIPNSQPRAYLLRPRIPRAANPQAPADPQTTLSPGAYEAVIGLNVTAEVPFGGYPIVRGNEDRIAALARKKTSRLGCSILGRGI